MQLFRRYTSALITTSIILLFSRAGALEGDDVSPYASGYAPDVEMDTAWDNYYPGFEGDGSPDFIGDDDQDSNATDPTPDLTRRAANSFYLRIMPLGASITEGDRSTDGTGYRKWLRSQLRWKGWNVNMVGSRQSGNMKDKDHEGHAGWVISQVYGAFQSSAWMNPNLVLINVGTNDCIQNIDTGNAGNRMKTMIDGIFNTIPGVTIVLSTVVKSRDFDTCASAVSQQYRDLVQNNYQGKRIVIADIWKALKVTDLSDDGIHPNDGGYKIFAAVWWDAISKIEGIIQPPIKGIDDELVSGPRSCSKVAGNARGPFQTQLGSGHDDGVYVHNRIERGIVESGRIQKNSDPPSITDHIPEHMFFANVVVNDPNFDRKGAFDDWIRIFHGTDGNNTYYYRRNNGDGTFGPSTVFDVGQDCHAGPRYTFADFNNDGLDDFFCLKQGSAVGVSLNRGGNPPKFEYIGQVVPAHAGFSEADVRIGDIDGDGRADYCLTKSDGDVICSRNAGVGDKYYWQGFSTAGGLRGTVFDKKKVDPTGIILGDINGDFRSDYLLVGDNGNVETWFNMRGWGSGIVPEWKSSGITHEGQPATGIQGNIKFGRIYGSGRLDYIYLKEEDKYYDMRVWQNTGGGGTKRKADGDFYCDMRGTGSDDYVWIFMDGHSTEIYANVHNPPYWGVNTKISLTVPGPRIGIHLADWTGDGRCDVLVQNKATGALTLWENQFDAAKNSLTFINRGVVTGAATCTEGWGVGIFDRGMRVADIDGDGRADFICIEAAGRITAWLNTKSGMQNVGQIKLSEGWDRANLRFADVEASGRADIIHLNKYTGAATVFKNKGHIPSGGGSGSSFSWTNRGVLYSPIDRGENMNFANQGGLGRADLIHTLPLTNRAWTFFNECGGGSGGDDGPITDPGLPSLGGGETDPGGGSGGGGSPPDYGNIDDCQTTWNAFTDIPDNAPLICKIWQLLVIAYDLINDSLNRYDSLLSDGYDKKFDIYADEMIDSATEVLQGHATEHGPDYFDCNVVEYITCCTGCTTLHTGADECRYCDKTGDVCNITSPFGGEKHEYRQVPEKCPPDFSERGIGSASDQSVYWKIRDDRASAFGTDVGIDSQYIAYGNHQFKDWNSATPRECLIDVPLPDECTYTGFFFGFPYKADSYTRDAISNPKQLISGSLDEWKDSRGDLGGAIEHLRNKTTIGDGVDPKELAVAIIFPAIMINASIGGMDLIVEKANEIEKEKRRENILTFLSVFFFIIPYVGVELEAVANTFIQAFGKIIAGLADTGTVGIGIYDSISDGNAADAFSAFAGVMLGRGIGEKQKVSQASSKFPYQDEQWVRDMGDAFVNAAKEVGRLIPFT